jgi:superfamily II DNA helicase RecQ
MAFHFFSVPITFSESAAEPLNAFLRSHRIIRVDRQLIDQGTSSVWALCVEYLDGASGPEMAGAPGAVRTRTDYREILSESDFAIFAKLRDARKAIAQSLSVPVYTIFTNEQLAPMVSTKATTRAALGQIEGLGAARLDKHGERMLEILATAWEKDAQP